MAIIEIKNIAKRFGSFVALDSIDLTINDQEFMVLLGASGCGKTTLLRIIAGLESPSEGEVWIDGRRVDQLPARDRGISMVFQNYAVFPHLTVFENIAFGLRMAKLPQQEVERRVHRTAEMMHIEQLLERYSGQLSGGQRQRVAVARALAMEPDVILMDEPLSNLDALLRMEMRAELKGVLAQSNTTTIYVTHDQVEAMSMADRISVMHQGHIVQAASPIEIYRNPATKHIGSFIGNPPMNFLPAQRDGDKWNVAGQLFDGPGDSSSSVELAIRPEDVSFSDSGIPAMVRIIEPLGPHKLLTCDVQGHLFRVVLDNNVDVKAFEQRTIQLKHDSIRWFDSDSQLAL